MSKIVSVITRTCNRPIFLRRLFENLCLQRFSDFVWIIVNDGGDKEFVNNLSYEAGQKGIEVSVIHHEFNMGMEAASNSGISASQSKYIVILDDDDTWESNFLLEMTSFLENKSEIYGGVVSHSSIVEEEVSGSRIIEKKRYIYNGFLQNIYLAQLANENVFNVNAFLFKRSCLDVVGSYDESLPVRGDWDFNIRFSRFFDIGVIPKPLANWHQRSPSIGSNSNSVVGQKHLHREIDARIRNKFLREDLNSGKLGLGFLMNMQARRSPFSVSSSLKSRVFQRLRMFFKW